MSEATSTRKRAVANHTLLLLPPLHFLLKKTLHLSRKCAVWCVFVLVLVFIVGVQRGISYVSLETPDEEYEHYVVSQYCSCSKKKKKHGVNIRWWRRRAWRSKPCFSRSLVCPAGRFRRGSNLKTHLKNSERSLKTPKKRGVNVPPRSNARHNAHTGRRSRLSWSCTYVGFQFFNQTCPNTGNQQAKPIPLKMNAQCW